MLMTLDHSRDMFSSVPIGDQLGTDLPLSYYFIRWITHLCAPTFVFLSGLSIVLRQQRYQMKIASLQMMVAKRGLFLMLLACSVVSVFWSIILRDEVFTLYCAELWAIGASMVFVALMLRVKPLIIFALSLALIAGHHLLEVFDHSESVIWAFLHVKKRLPLITGYVDVITFYPLLPWMGIGGLGYCAGHYFFNDTVSDTQRRKGLFTLVAVLLVTFVVLRLANVYGEPNLFVAHPDSILKTLFSFFDVTKYPPSLLYACITLSFGCLVLAMSDSKFFQKPNRWVVIVSRYGSAALFYYVFHLFLIAMYAYLIAYVFNDGTFYTSSYLGFSLMIAVIVMMTAYPIMRKFTELRSKYRQQYPILTYL